jgi:predicted DNA-binding transcriptional regulator AlpA
MCDVTKPRTLRLVQIAELFGVTKQRAYQIATEDSFPAPVGEDARGRVWSRNEVQTWAKRWRREKLVRRDDFWIAHAAVVPRLSAKDG